MDGAAIAKIMMTLAGCALAALATSDLPLGEWTEVVQTFAGLAAGALGGGAWIRRPGDSAPPPRPPSPPHIGGGGSGGTRPLSSRSMRQWSERVLCVLVLVSACTGCGGSPNHTDRVDRAQGVIGLAEVIVEETHAAYLESFDRARGHCDDLCMARYVTVAAALDGARDAVRAADYAATSADDGYLRERLACMAAAVSALLQAASLVEALPVNETIGVWGRYAEQIGAHACEGV